MYISSMPFLLGLLSMSIAKPIPALNELFPTMPPHCVRAVITTTHPSQLNDSSLKLLRKQLKIGVGQTVCFKIIDDQGGGNDPSNPHPTKHRLHTLTLGQLEQYYSITQRYRFAIPEVSAKCICECNAEAETCRSLDYQYAACPGGNSNRLEACHRTFFDKQPQTGCTGLNSPSPRLCCEVKFRPYQNRTFTALKLGPASTYAVLRYSAFEWNNGKWSEEDKKSLRISMDGVTYHQYLDTDQEIELSVNAPGKASNQLSPDMYFVENMAGRQYGEIIKQPLNEITDHNFYQLGWYRMDDDDNFYVHHGNLMMDKIHKAYSENCQEQKYQTILDASYYINQNSNDSTQFNIAETLTSSMRWIKSARIVDSSERHAIITENEGSNLEITLNARPDEDLHFLHNVSKIDDFSGSIIIDRHSNAFLNLTIFNASGILNGYLKEATSSFIQDMVDTFTVYIPETLAPKKDVLVRVKPYQKDIFVQVCIRPEEGAPNSEICRFVQSKEEELATEIFKNSWDRQIGHCEACNKFMNDFIKNLNPLEWFNEISSAGELFTRLIDIFGYIAVFIVAYIILTRCIIPIVQCCICPMSCFTRKK